MALKTIPLLPEDYPLFSWDDWPDSLAALVPGGPTKNFEMACWNALVTYLSDAITDAGLDWHTGADLAGNGGHTVEETYITDGILRLYMFNQMVRNTYARVPLYSWLWVKDEKFRGYTGYIYFSKYKRNYVYPEYITELVYRINQLVEIMRGTWPILDVTPKSILMPAPIQTGLAVDKSAPVIRDVKACTSTRAEPLRVLPAFPMKVGDTYKSLTNAGAVEMLIAGPLAPWQNSHFLFQFGGRVFPSARIRVAQSSVGIKSEVMLEALITVECGTNHRATSKAAAGLNQGQVLPTERLLKLVSWCIANAVKLPPAPTVVKLFNDSLISVAGDKLPSQHTSAYSRTTSRRDVTINTSKPLACGAKEKTGTDLIFDVEAYRAAYAAAKDMAVTKSSSAAVQTPPLHITQGQPCETARDVRLIVGRVRPGWVEKKSTTDTAPTLTAGEAVAVEPEALAKSKARPAAVKIKSTATTAKSTSKSAVVCTLASAWLPPVWVDGGLHIRQVHDVPVQNENGELVIA